MNYKFEGVEYSITIEEVAIFPQGYAALMTEVGLLQDEPSMLLMDLGGWTVDLMRIDNAIPAVLLGGGASVVSRHLSPKDALCKTIFLLDDKVNAVGFERALAAVSRRKGEA